MLPDPAPYPYELRRLANGEMTWHGFRELFTCSPGPEWEAFFERVHGKEIALGSPAANRNTVDNGPASPKIVVGR
jgi:hypothetical protein